MTFKMRLTRRTFLQASALAGAAGATGVVVTTQFDDDEPDRRSALPVPTPDPTKITTEPRIDEEIEGFLAVAPRVLRSGQVENVSFALFQNDLPARSTVRLVLHQEDVIFAEATGYVPGRAAVPLAVPVLAAGEYTLRVSGKGFAESAQLQVQDGTILFLETDKPIYKPG